MAIKHVEIKNYINEKETFFNSIIPSFIIVM